MVEETKPAAEEAKPAEEAPLLEAAAVEENPEAAVIEDSVAASENKDEESNKEA